MDKINKFFLVLFSLGCIFSCASRHDAAIDYKSSFSKQPHQRSQRTVLLFLIDGLSLDLLKSELSQGHLPHIKNYFVGSKNQFYKARTGFPSVTYPSVASLLTESSIDLHGIYGNKIIKNNEYFNFESPTDFEKLDELTYGKNIFNRLAQKNQNSVSFSFTFNQEATAHIGNTDLKSALSVQTQDYAYVDNKFIDALEILLTENKPQQWPAFIYVHLIGVDFLSHQYGPRSPVVKSYLKSLDKKLNKIFVLLKKAEKKKDIMALMTSDHGYDKPVTKRIQLKSLLPKDLSDDSILNEGRLASFHFPANWTSLQKMQYVHELKQNPLLDIIAYRENQSVHLASKDLTTQIFYGVSNCLESSFSMSIGTDTAYKVCPQQIPYQQNQLFYPYFATHISQYFHSPGHPDIVLITKPGVSFNHSYRGQHGGPTAEEIFVPLLIRNGHLPDGPNILPLSDLLKFL